MVNIKVSFKKCGLANVFLIIGQKTIIVDTGLSGHTQNILTLLEENCIKKEDVSLILITHAHPDHCLNAKHLKETIGAPIAISVEEAHHLEEGTFAPVVPRNFFGAMIYNTLRSIHQPHDKTISPEVCFNKELDLNRFGVEGKAILTPGHTLGSSSILLGNGLCIAGDMLLPFPITKRPQLSLFVEDMDLLQKSIATIINTNAKFIYFSHGNGWEIDLIRKVVLPKL